LASSTEGISPLILGTCCRNQGTELKVIPVDLNNGIKTKAGMGENGSSRIIQHKQQKRMKMDAIISQTIERAKHQRLVAA